MAEEAKAVHKTGREVEYQAFSYGTTPPPSPHLAASIRQLRDELASFSAPLSSRKGTPPPSPPRRGGEEEDHRAPSSPNRFSSAIDVELRLVLLLCQSSVYRPEDWEEAKDRAESLWERLHPSSSFGGVHVSPPSRVGMQTKLASSLRRACLQRGDPEAGEVWTRRFQDRLHWRKSLEEMAEEVAPIDPRGPSGQGDSGYALHPSSSRHRHPQWRMVEEEEEEENEGGAREEHRHRGSPRMERWSGAANTRMEREERQGGQQVSFRRDSPISSSFSPGPLSCRPSREERRGMEAEGTARKGPGEIHGDREGGGGGGSRSRDSSSHYSQQKEETPPKRPSSKRAATPMETFKKSLLMDHPQLRWGKLKGGPTPGPRYTG